LIIGVVEPKTLHLDLIKEASLALGVEEFTGALEEPIAVPLLQFVSLDAGNMVDVFAGRLPVLGTGCQHPAARHCRYREGERE